MEGVGNRNFPTKKRFGGKENDKGNQIKQTTMWGYCINYFCWYWTVYRRTSCRVWRISENGNGVIRGALWKIYINIRLDENAVHLY